MRQVRPAAAAHGPILCELRCDFDGERLFKQVCAACHGIELGEESYARPVRATYGRWLPQREGPHRLVDDAFIRESILDPSAHVTWGHQPVMPSFKGQFKQDHLDALVEYYRAMR